MPSAYIISQVELFDEEAFAEYKAAAPASVEKFGGEYLVRGGRYQSLEGREPHSRIVVMKFESYEKALAWYNSEEYTRLKAIRSKAARGDILLVEGLD
ncbi:MAG: DUF1330 domain-containing protein [Rhizobiaceae bacterium]|nr:DUF1330 domain-containing protein [Rhizobiaceae bacterium]